MDVVLSDHPVRIVLSSMRSRAGAALITHNSTRDARSYLQSQASRPGVMDELRELVSNRAPQPLLSHDDVLHAVAVKVAMGQLFVLQLAPQTSAGLFEGGEPEPAPVAKRPAVSSPAPVPPPTKPAPVTPAPTASPERTTALMQDVQAQSLEAAAVDGTPFCEICEKPGKSQEVEAA